MVLSLRCLLDYHLLLLPSRMLISPCIYDLALFWTEYFWPKKPCFSSLLTRNSLLTHWMSGRWEDHWRTTLLRPTSRVLDPSARQKRQMHGKNYGQGRSPVCVEVLLPAFQSSTKHKEVMICLSFGLSDVGRVS